MATVPSFPPGPPGAEAYHKAKTSAQPFAEGARALFHTRNDWYTTHKRFARPLSHKVLPPANLSSYREPPHPTGRPEREPWPELDALLFEEVSELGHGGQAVARLHLVVVVGHDDAGVAPEKVHTLRALRRDARGQRREARGRVRREG